VLASIEDLFATYRENFVQGGAKYVPTWPLQPIISRSTYRKGKKDWIRKMS